MDFYDVVAQVVQLLQQQGRVTYRGLKFQFTLDDETLEALKEELLFSHPVADEDSRGLVWTDETEDSKIVAAQSDQAEPQPVVEHDQPAHVHTPSIESSAPDAERRQLTILFTDLVDSTKLSGQIDAEDYREIVRAYQAACAEVIARFDCHLAQTLGDGLLIYSGYPIAHENDAERTVRTGLGILEAMKALNEQLEQDKGIRLGIRVGIHTGPVVVGEVGTGSRHEQLALGEVPNVAARIQGLAEPNTAVISAATYQLVEGYFNCETLGEQVLRGVTDSITVYRVLGESGAQSRLDVASTRGLTPLVGREQEVGLLFERWEQVKDGQGQVVLLSGEAGIGKSRLVQVLKDRVTEDAHTRLECRSSPYYQNTALYPITDLLQRTLQFQPDDTSDEKLAKLEQELRQYRLPLEESIQLFAPLVSVSIPEDRYPSLNLSPQRQRQKTLEAIVGMLLEQAEQQPVLFIVEDNHWLDPTSLELLDLLIDQTPTAQMLTLITYRPEFQPPWGNRSYLSQITLNRLSQHQIAQLAAHVAGDKSLPPDVLQQLVEKTDGVPLYVEEMTKSVLESGLLTESNGQYEVVHSLSSLTIPSTLQDSLMSRLARLVTAKAVAQYASVIGRQFSYELLHAVSQVDEETLRKELRRLVEAELLYQRGLPPHATYTFKHALIQDVAYASLLKSTRQQYHQHIAQVLEARFPATVATLPELLAHHYTEAGLITQAIGYWQIAGQRASERSAVVEAVRHFEKGLDALHMLPDTSERARQELALHVALSPVLVATKGNASPDVERTCARALQLSQQLEDNSLHFAVLQNFVTHYNARPDYYRAYDLGQQLLALAEAQHDADRLLEAHRALAATLLYRGDVGAARDHFEQGIAFYDPQSSPSLALRVGADPGVVCHIYNAVALWWLGYPDQGEVLLHQGIRLVQASSHRFSKGWALVWAAQCHQCRRDIQAVQELSEQSLRIFTDLGSEMYIAKGHALQGWVCAMRGRSAEGIRQLQRGLESWRATQAYAQAPQFLSLLAEAYLQNGQTEEACVVLTEALDRVDKQQERFYEAEIHRLKGQLLLAQSPDSHAEAETCFQQAITIAQNQSAKSWELRAATSLAKLWQSQGKRMDAYELLAPVYGWFTEGHDTADLQDAKTLLDELK